MRWPSLFALLPNCEVECVNINQMVPVILKQASPLPATHPLPPLSTALTLSSHFSPRPSLPSPLFSNLATPSAWYLPAFFPGLVPLSFFSLPGQVLPPQAVGFHLTTGCSSPLMSPNIAMWESVAEAPVKPSAAHQAHGGWLCLLFKWMQFASQPCNRPASTAQQRPSVNTTASHHGPVESEWMPWTWEKAQLGFSA